VVYHTISLAGSLANYWSTKGTKGVGDKSQSLIFVTDPFNPPLIQWREGKTLFMARYNVTWKSISIVLYMLNVVLSGTDPPGNVDLGTVT